jgi:hypothetical protein
MLSRMGYDMHMVQPPAKLPPGYRPQYVDTPGYHRLNIHWMPLVRESMRRAGALDDYDVGPLPEWPPEGLDEERAMELMDAIEEERTARPPMTDAERRRVNAYEAAREEGLAALSPKGAGHVPYWKFCSNDGWLVAPAECRVIAERLSSALEKRGAKLWEGFDKPDDSAREVLHGWLGFVRLAADHGGFRVR